MVLIRVIDLRRHCLFFDHCVKLLAINGAGLVIAYLCKQFKPIKLIVLTTADVHIRKHISVRFRYDFILFLTSYSVGISIVIYI